MIGLMLAAALGALVLVRIYRLMKSGSEYVIDWWMAFVFMLCPAILTFLLLIGLGFFGFPREFVALGYILYFLIPFLILKFGLNFSTRPALKHAAVVPVLALLMDTAVLMILGTGDA